MRNTRHIFGPDDLYAYCLDRVRKQHAMLPALFSLDTCRLLWTNTIAQAHAMETAFRALSANGSSDPQEVAKSVGAVLMSLTPTRLYDMWHAWDTEHGEWPLIDTLWVPIYFLSCQMTWVEGRKEVARRGRELQLPVFKAWAGLTAGPPQPDAVRIQRLTSAMGNTLYSTVHRHLYPSRETSSNAMMDAENVMLSAVVERESRGRARLVELLSRERAITSDDGPGNDAYAIPVLPLLGMQSADGIDVIWRAAAKESALKCLANIAPGILGLLETTLSDAAHAAQRTESDLPSAKKRGGSGGSKAKKAGTEAIPVQHVQFGDPAEDAGCVDPETLAGHRLTPDKELEARKDAERAFAIAVDRWGEGGKRMLEALWDGENYNDAAKAAGISAPALIKRRATLRKLLKD